MRFSIRRSVLVISFVLSTFLYFCGPGLYTLLSLWTENWQNDRIWPSELNSTYLESHPPRIPKIIHQTWANSSIPPLWKQAQQTCIDLHEDWEYMLWTDSKASLFIAAEYPWFLDTWESYRYNIQRADVIRYFVLAHYGGIYLDFDKGCNKSLDPLLTFPAFVRATRPTGISNDIMGAVPNHPFFVRVIQSLMAYDRSWLVPYITIMYSTGPLFLSVIWKEYIRWTVSAAARVRVLMPSHVDQAPFNFFDHYAGSSWHNSDAKTILWMGQHIALTTTMGFALGIMVLILLRWVYLASCAMETPRSPSSPPVPRRPIFPWRRPPPRDVEYFPLVDRKV